MFESESMEFFNTVKQVQKNWTPYKKWEIEQQKKDKQNEELRKKYPPTPEELEHAKQYGRTIVDVINTMDQHSIDKAEDASFAVHNALMFIKLGAVFLGGFLGSFGKLNSTKFNKTESKIYSSIIGMIISGTITGAISRVYGATIEKQASRIARFQTRENDLKDSRNFVIYNEKQIQEAEEIAKTMPDVKDKSKNLTLKKSLNPIETFSKASKTTKYLAKDYAKYSEWKQKYLKEDEKRKTDFKTMSVPEEDLNKAQKDRDIMLNTIRKIENSSLNYLMDMHLALLMFAIGIGTLGLGLGIGFVKILDSLQKNKKITQNNAHANIAKFGGLKVIPFALSFLLIGPVIKLEKDAARIGRYKAKQELLSNPQNFIGFDENQRKTVGKDYSITPERKNFLSIFKKDFENIKRLKRDYKEYHEYLNNEHKHELKLNEALKQVKITKEQEIEAINIQKHAFHSFEKMDEKAQRFVDDTNAAVGIGNKLISSILQGAAKIFAVSIIFKKLDDYSKSNINSFNDAMKQLFKHFKGNDLIKITLPMIFASIISQPFYVKGIQIEKEAGKIGVMQAMQDLDDPKNFLDEKN